jgi:Tfp pilus assembly protein PilZ
MEILAARFASKEALLAAWDATLPHGGMFVPTTRPLAPGAPVVIELSGHALPEHVFVRATVVSARPAAPRQCLCAGVVVAADPSERATVDFILAAARSEVSPERRRMAPRLPVSLTARYRRVEQPGAVAAEVLDISTGGLALRVPEDLPVATRIVVELPVPGALAALELAGEVVFWCSPVSRAGVRFTWHGVSGVRRVREAIRRLRAA